MSDELSLVATSQRTTLPALPSAQQAYVLVEILPVAPGLQVEAPPVNLCLVLDRSGSMAGTKMSAMKAAAKQVVDRLGPQDRLAVVVFDDASPADLVIPSGPMLDQEDARRKIETIEERGGTHMSTGMRLGLNELRGSHHPERVSAMLLLTDGQTWEDADDCRALAQECQSAGIPIHVLGLGVGEQSNWDPRLLEDLAQRSGGEWMPVEAPELVSQAFEKILSAIKAAIATQALLTMRFVQGVSTRAVWRLTPLIGRLEAHSSATNDIQVFLGDIQHGTGQSILVDLAVPPKAPGAYRLMQADVTYSIPGRGLTDQKITTDLVLNFVAEAGQASQLNQRLMNLIERVMAHKLQTQALDEAAEGDAARATQRLRAAATRLLELGELEMAQQTRQQAEQLERTGQLDLAASQKMRYATKRLTEIDLGKDAP
jgi:Ca-activated chloride channel homolog